MVPLFDELIFAKHFYYSPSGFELRNFKLNSESKEYHACSFFLNEYKIQYRLSKITPKKAGQFVTVWKRDSNGVTVPYGFEDDFDFIIITSKSENNFGQFIFPKSVLANMGVITKNGKLGKRGFRIYPSWDVAKTASAKKNQIWQLKYFILYAQDKPVDFNKVFYRLTKIDQEIATHLINN